MYPALQAVVLKTIDVAQRFIARLRVPRQKRGCKSKPLDVLANSPNW